MIDVIKKNKESRTTLTLSLSVEDKKALKLIAADQETTISALIHDWIQKKATEKKE